jgi:hypothetical protein
MTGISCGRRSFQVNIQSHPHEIRKKQNIIAGNGETRTAKGIMSLYYNLTEHVKHFNPDGIKRQVLSSAAEEHQKSK